MDGAISKSAIKRAKSWPRRHEKTNPQQKRGQNPQTQIEGPLAPCTEDYNCRCRRQANKQVLAKTQAQTYQGPEKAESSRNERGRVRLDNR